jgi:hypothetical protein
VINAGGVVDRVRSVPRNGERRRPSPDDYTSPFGRVFTPKELSVLWQLSENSIRRLFQDEPGIFTLGRTNSKGKRTYCTLRIPEHVALMVWRKRGGAL